MNGSAEVDVTLKLQNDTDPADYVLTVEDWIAFVGLWLVAVFTVVGNTLVILSFIRDRKLREKPSNLFLLALAMTDLITGLVSLPLDNMWRLRDAWPYGRNVCLLWTFLDYTATVQSSYIISLISVDRYLLVTKGLHYKFFQTRRRVLFQIVGTLSFSFIFHLCAIVWYDGAGHVDFDEECELNGLGALVYVVLALTLEFILPLLVVCVFNTVIYLRIRRRISRRQTTRTENELPPADSQLLNNAPAVKPVKNPKQSNSSEEASTLETTFELEVSSKPSNCAIETPKTDYIKSGKPSSSRHPIKRKANARKSSKRAATTLSVLTVVFIVCWLPYNVVAIVRNISSDLVSVRTWDLVNYLLWLNSAVNPVLYATTNVEFRRNFCELVGKLFIPFERLFGMT